MPRFFVKDEEIQNENITISGEDFNHIKNVLRLRQGDSLVISDGNCTDYDVVIDSYESSYVVTRIVGKYKNNNESDIDITLFQGIPKSDKMDMIIQKSVEMGVKRIVPVLTERTVVKINSEKDSKNKITRWQRIAQEASKQCNRGIMPTVENPVTFYEAVAKLKRADLSLIPYEKESGNKLKSVIKGNDAKTISVMIGPEGGFSNSEVDLAVENGFVPVTLGPRILRTETAGLSVLSIIMYELGDLG
ncbi:16S rRNA (uracil(1498)-N(3))-methyltransferase [Pseudobacteroides cellulosolvens]|uniref:Ribosomal RNA small subunit methyltransferase E n=1 Tax=Pseudobacteroides cellulosolvens ATCC 35603 = DSM 2933 TaxID=398512 RepID=A0A0L6JLU2_9FIRM|nr:16S rRNA (uracil(1498)-N(3))-methyltransferase [Pseudobacteroides cellulosolvens]KNY26791.1 Ribosomal RNA small subunit methyltransferase E [Pseudobacteroides cellulosolvens ATCC 35603 = DSM 2933]